MRLFSPSLYHKSTTLCWVFIVSVLSFFQLATAHAVTPLDGFNLENDAQGSIRIRLNTPQPVQVEEQRQQGVYKLILKNTSISNKMKQEGLPVVMDAQGKYIARATQLSNNQVSITIPNGVELHQHIEVVGGASTLNSSIEEPSIGNLLTLTPEENQTLITLQKTAPTKPKAVKKIGLKPSLKPKVARTAKLPTEKSAVTQSLADKDLTTSETPAIATSSVETPATQALLATEADATVPLFSENTATIMLQEQTSALAEATLPTETVFNADWLNNRFLPSAETEPTAQDDGFPWFSFASFGVGTALTLGLGLWVYQQGFLKKQANTSVVMPEVPAAIPPEAPPLTPAISAEPAFSTATQQVVNSLFNNTLKQVAVETVDNAPEALPAKAVVAQPLPLSVVATPFKEPVLIPTPKIALVPAVKTPAVASLQQTLVKTIKQHDAKTTQSSASVKPPALAIGLNAVNKKDFKSITERLGRKKFQGIY